MRKLPPLSGLQAFEAAARLLSFTEAAKELNCTQAAISQRVRALETYLARQLFLRKSNGLRLSEAGEAFLPGVAQALDAAAAATEGLSARGTPRAVTLSAPLSFLTLWLTPRLGDILSGRADFDLRLNGAIWTDPNADLADIVVQVRDGADRDRDAPCLPPERLLLVAAPAIAETLATATLERDLKGRRRIVIQGRHDLWRRWASGMGVRSGGDVPALKVDNAVCALEAAAHGLGVTVAYGAYCAPYLAAGRLVEAQGGALQTDLRHTATIAADRPSWHPARRMFALLAEAFRRA